MRRALLAAVVIACGTPPPRAAVFAHDPRIDPLDRVLRSAHIQLEYDDRDLRGEARIRRAGGNMCGLASAARAADTLGPLAVALARYPSVVLEAAQIDRFALCVAIVSDSYDRDVVGTADLGARRVMISLDPFGIEIDDHAKISRRPYDPDEPLNVEDIVHHEVFHMLESARMSEWTTDDVEWRLENPIGFKYPTTNATVITEPSTDSSLQAGFVSHYATSSEAEDRASTFELLMARPERLCALVHDDRAIAAKARMIWARVAAVTHDEEFMRRRVPCAGSEHFTD